MIQMRADADMLMPQGLIASGIPAHDVGNVDRFSLDRQAAIDGH